MNPEFQRNLYLEVSLARLIGMPLSLFLIYFFTYIINDQHIEALASVSIWLYVFIVLLWGARQSSESISDELRNHTWDIQKTSAISPWSLAWGKLFGSTLFNWYGGILCILVYAFTAKQTDSILSQPTFSVFMIIVYGISTGILAQALSLLISLLALRRKQLSHSGFSYLLALFLLFFMSMLIADIYHNPFKETHWFQFVIQEQSFYLISLVLACIWSLVGIYRLLCQELQIRTFPWVWLGFTLFLVVYIQGLIIGHNNTDSSSISENLIPTTIFMLVTFSVSAFLTYGLILMDNNSPMLPRRLWLYANQENWRRFLEELPCWFISLIIALPACLYLTVFFPGETTEKLHFYPIPAFLLMVRDIALILFFNYAPNPKRALGLSLLYLTFLYWVIPAIFIEAHAEGVAGLFLPLFYEELGLAILVAGVQVGIIGYLVFQRWDKTLNRFQSNDYQ